MKDVFFYLIKNLLAILIASVAVIAIGVFGYGETFKQNAIEQMWFIWGALLMAWFVSSDVKRGRY
jgi:hypothetical protein